MSSGTYPLPVSYKIENVGRKNIYVLCDGISLESTFFLHNVSKPAGEDESYFAAKKEERSGKIEKSFGVLQKKFYIVALSSRLWRCERIENIIKRCIIIHNMIEYVLRTLDGMWWSVRLKST